MVIRVVGAAVVALVEIYIGNGEVAFGVGRSRIIGISFEPDARSGQRVAGIIGYVAFECRFPHISNMDML